MTSEPLTFSPRQLHQLCTVVREEVQVAVREEIESTVPQAVKVAVHDAVKSTLPQAVKTAVQVESSATRREFLQELAIIKQVQGSQGIILRAMQSDVNSIKAAYRRQSVLIEDLGHQFIAVAELLSNNLTVRAEVNNHAKRLTTVETTQKLLRKTVTAHSRQLIL